MYPGYVKNFTRRSRDTSPGLAALCRALEESDRFWRDRGLGNIYHRGKVSFRELSPRDSTHIVVDGNRVSAHVDLVSPLKRRRDGSVRYSVPRVVAHNLVGMGSDLTRRVRRRHGGQRCTLECEVVWVDNESSAEMVADPAAGPTVAAACPNEPPAAVP